MGEEGKQRGPQKIGPGVPVGESRLLAWLHQTTGSWSVPTAAASPISGSFHRIVKSNYIAQLCPVESGAGTVMALGYNIKGRAWPTLDRGLGPAVAGREPWSKNGTVEGAEEGRARSDF